MSRIHEISSRALGYNGEFRRKWNFMRQTPKSIKWVYLALVLFAVCSFTMMRISK